MSIVAYPTQTPHPAWCDPRDCSIVDRRPDDLSMLLVHALTVWRGHAGRRLELIQTETLDHAGNPLRTYRPMVMPHGDLTAGFDARGAERLGRAMVRAADLADRDSLPISPEVAAMNALIDFRDPS